MNVETRTRKLTTVALAGLLGLALAAGPAVAQQASDAEQAPAHTREPSRQIKVKILGMSCPFCAYGVEQKLEELEGVKELQVELKSGVATLTMEEGADVTNEKLKKTVDDAGFEAAAIVRSFDSEHPDWNPQKLAGNEGSEGTSGKTSG